VGDCDGSGDVTIDELFTLVNITLGNSAVTACGAGDANADGEITIDEILAAVNIALSGCSGSVATLAAHTRGGSGLQRVAPAP
jgi:hypothetical protein